MQDQTNNGVVNQQALIQARSLTEAALATMRRISHELMPPQLEKFGLVKTLDAIAIQINQANKINLDFHSFDEAHRWPIIIEIGLYRICMEMINNTLKHAEAKRIRIQLEQENDYILFSYNDDGKGLPEAYSEGLGFKTIEARLSALGGKSEIGKNELGGFSAHLRIPVSE
jgi:signal transduction histidine kinase